MKAISGVVTHIQDFSVHDGDGIRTTVFLAGCSLRCQWCANPETWDTQGTVMTVGEVLGRVLRSAVFFRESGGGVTFSGGEPGFQPDFLKALIDACDELGVDMALETSGYFRWEEISHHMGKLSLVFVDIKHMDDSVHQRLTGRGNREIQENIRRIGALGIRTVIRVPLIKGINDSDFNLRETAGFVRAAVPGGVIEILPYHDLATSKYIALGLNPPGFQAPTDSDMAGARKIIEKEGVQTVEFR